MRLQYQLLHMKCHVLEIDFVADLKNKIASNITSNPCLLPSYINSTSNPELAVNISSSCTYSTTEALYPSVMVNVYLLLKPGVPSGYYWKRTWRIFDLML